MLQKVDVSLALVSRVAMKRQLFCLSERGESEVKEVRVSIMALGFLTSLFGFSSANAADLKIGDPAPLFSVKDDKGAAFDLKAREGKWTVLYFYPQAETPGCTKQACAFRDNLKKITSQGAEVYGISTDTVEDQAKFREHHKLNFTLLADPDAKVTEQYGAKMPVLKKSKRWTFIIDPQLKIRSMDQDVDPAMDADKVAKKIAELKK
jgi:thioredoxin-dependent peroxiredoxin